MSYCDRYRDKMDNLMAADDGLPRRFQRSLHLEDYTPTELAQICTKVAGSHPSSAAIPH